MTAPAWHRSAWSRLRARIDAGTLPHALMLAGPTGLGKRAFAQRLLASLLCPSRDADGDACGQCRSCLLLHAGTHPDVVRVTLETRKDGNQRSELVVEQIRDLSARLALASQFGGWQVALIDPADAMNAAAANALLKTLEEPTAQTILLLLADAPWRLPQTIRSRCQRIEFALPPREEALAWLRAQGVVDAAVALDAAAGNPGLALAWSQDGALARRASVRADLAALAAGRGEAMEVLRRWLDDQPAQRLWFAVQAASQEARHRASAAGDALGSKLDDEALADWFDAANRTREALRGPLRPDLLVFELLARWC